MASTTPTLGTVGGTPVEFIPLPTAWTSGVDCSNNIYQQFDGTFIGWDPLYGISWDTAQATCLPPAVTTWWFDFSALPVTALGPTFVCPSAYSAVLTAVVDGGGEEVFCCPS